MPNIPPSPPQKRECEALPFLCGDVLGENRVSCAVITEGLTVERLSVKKTARRALPQLLRGKAAGFFRAEYPTFSATKKSAKGEAP